MKHIVQTFGAIAMFTFATNPGAAADTQAVNPAGLYDPTPNGYSHVVVAGDFAFIAGQGGETRTGHLAPDFEAQVAQAYRNLATALDGVGAGPEHVVKLTTYVVDHDQSKLIVLTRQLQGVFGSHLPAQTLVPVPRLALDGMLFEVDAIAVLNAGNAER
ncbi:RidA family protein [uncultured Roseobacter sp.]|uniref:RidA family protein n=1 Tax=uncultured Roseobacter sp. TaxID=114847 RepID=UPI00260C3B6B|nr:RidA family protein [uncultured Roseobacter sp.]